MERNLQRRQRPRHDKLGFGIPKEHEDDQEEDEELGFNFPKELEVEILRRLPINSIMRFRCVSKSWKSFIQSDYFVNMHLTPPPPAVSPSNINNNDRLVALLGMLNHEVRVVDKASFTKELFRFHTGEKKPLALSFIGTCNGLICIQAMTPDWNIISRREICTMLVYLWNPVRGVTKTIDRCTFPGDQPELSQRYFTNYGFGYDSRNNDYKVVKLEHHRSSKSCNLKKVYSLSTNSWKFIRSTPPLTCYPRCVPATGKDRPPQPFVNGATHWLADSCSSTNFNDQGLVISFDFCGEVFGEISLPSSSDKGTLVSYKSLLAFMVPHHDRSVASPGKLTFHLWVMREYGVAESWTKLYTIDSPTLEALESPLNFQFRGFGEDENDHVFRAKVANPTQPRGITFGLYFVKSCNSSQPTFTSSSARLLYHSRCAVTFRPSLVSFSTLEPNISTLFS